MATHLPVSRKIIVEAQPSSVVKWAATLREIRLLAPSGIFKLMPNDKLNIDDMRTELSQNTQPPDQKSEWLPDGITKFQAAVGEFTADDSTAPNPARKGFPPLLSSWKNEHHNGAQGTLPLHRPETQR